MKLRSVISILLIACLVMFAAACGGGGGGGDDDPAGGGGNGGTDNGGGGGNGGTETTPNYLCFTSSDYFSFKLKVEGNLPVPNLEYSKDGSNWIALGSSPVALEPGEKVYLRGNNTEFSSDEVNYVHFEMTGSNITASGNIMSLVDKTCESVTIPSDSCFIYLFRECTALTSAPELPATTLATGCYACMFEGCTNLTSAPELPATTLKDYCYSNMFVGCTNLTVAPELPATTLSGNCYEGMFYGCSKLSSIKVHFTDWNDSDYSTDYWVYGVADSGTFTCPVGLSHTELEDFGASRIPKTTSKRWTINTLD